VDAQSDPLLKFSILQGPSAIAASKATLCDIDLSPGNEIVLMTTYRILPKQTFF
jgi:hypothetical protein